MVKAENVSIRYLAGDFSDVGLKEWVIQKIKKERKVEPVWAVQDVNFTLESGDFLGIIGTNGAGKSTLLKSVTGILEPRKGKITTDGNVIALLELGTGFDGDLNLRENILMRGALLGFSKEFIEEKTDEILEFAELTDFQWYKYKQLSSGMRSRLAFSICCMVNPDVLILDEVLSVGDGSFRQKSSEKMLNIIKGGAITLFVGHSTVTMRQLATKILWLDRGKQIAFADNRGDAVELLALYEIFLKIRSKNPKAVPDIDDLRKRYRESKIKAAAIEKSKSSLNDLKLTKEEQQLFDELTADLKNKLQIKTVTLSKIVKFERHLLFNPELITKAEEKIKEITDKPIVLCGNFSICYTLKKLFMDRGIAVAFSGEATDKALEDIKNMTDVDLILTTNEKTAEDIRKLTNARVISTDELFCFKITG